MPRPDPGPSPARPRRERWLLGAQVGLGALTALAWFAADDVTGWTAPGLGLLALALVLALAAGRALGPAFRVAPSPRPGARLVQRGVYRWLRHPMYLAVALALGGAACLRPSLPVLVLVGLNLGLYFVKARYEEAVLLHHYPDYARYRRGTVGVRPSSRPEHGPGSTGPGDDC